MDTDALWNMVGHWNVLAEADADSPNDELSNNIAVAHGQSLGFGRAARELSDFLETLPDRSIIGNQQEIT